MRPELYYRVLKRFAHVCAIHTCVCCLHVCGCTCTLCLCVCERVFADDDASLKRLLCSALVFLTAGANRPSIQLTFDTHTHTHTHLGHKHTATHTLTHTQCRQVGEFSADLAIAEMPIMSTINKSRLTICRDSFDSIPTARQAERAAIKWRAKRGR